MRKKKKGMRIVGGLELYGSSGICVYESNVNLRGFSLKDVNI